jgi:NADH-quinone oxidoreductase subunit L
MSMSLIAAALAATVPLAAFFITLVFTRKRPWLSAGISIAAVSISSASALFLLLRHWGMTEPLLYMSTWMVSGPINIPVGVLLDPLSILMLVIVSGICLLVQIYSIGYMAGDPGFSRYFSFMSLFAWAMITLTISPNMLQLYVFWELVGLSSYLLIGFWYEQFSASQAGKKAFVMTRLGDVAFLIGMLLVLVHAGNLNISEMNSPEASESMSPFIITLAVLLIFGGIIGKSAQFPLLTWLPDAMEGPTPVSALLHSATMVAAGVYLFARLFPFFSLSPTAMTICLFIGTISMLLASTMAMVSRDIKQVWAYSTISQLGYMIMGLAAGGYVAGVFHLTTHAAFKALLFLCSGVFIHSLHTNDMFEIAKSNGRRMKIPVTCMVIAGAALAGLPPLSGFFSKELILAKLASLDNPVWFACALTGVFVTAYYTFRLIFIILFPKPDPLAAESGLKTEEETEKHMAEGHQGSKFMVLPLIILAAVTLVIGLFEGPIDRFLSLLVPESLIPEDMHHGWMAIWALGLSIAGVLLAFVEFGLPKTRQVGFAERIPFIYNLFSKRWYIDHVYRYFLDYVIDRGVAGICTLNDQKVIDKSIDTFCDGIVENSRLFSFLHTGMIQYRLIVVFATIFFLSLYLFLG